MMRLRRRKEEEHDNLDRWLISYADFITLMFTFFAALYALSTIDKAKVEKFSGSLRQVFNVIEQPISLPENPNRGTAEDIRKVLGSYQGISVKSEQRGAVITFSDGVLFPSGSAEVKPQSNEMLERVSDFLRTTPSPIVIEGHTDTTPISGGKYASNWELSTARAGSVLSFFISKGLDPNRFTIAGYGEYRPIASNSSDEGRAKNRRVEIIIKGDRQ